MKDYYDGQYIKENDFIQSHAPCLQFIFNTDSLEVVNPIGAHVKKHKIGIFYWSLANLRPTLRSIWTNIHLPRICKTKDLLKNQGLKIFLRDFVNALQKLSNGIEMIINGNKTKIYGTLLAVLANTPATAFIANMKQSFFTKKVCQNCNINTEDMQNVIKVSALEGRCPNLHLQ